MGAPAKILGTCFVAGIVYGALETGAVRFDEGITFHNPLDEEPSCVDVGSLSDTDKAGQMLIVLVEAGEAQRLTELADHHIGNFALLGSLRDANVVAGRPSGDTAFYGATIKAAKSRIEAVTGQPAGVALDEEGGRVQRSRGLDGAVDLPSAREQGSHVHTEDIQELYYNHSAWLAETLGITISLAPVIDVGDGLQLGDRTYGLDAATVERNARAAIEGMKLAGVAPTGKHMPGGLGELDVDMHDESAVTLDLGVLEQTEIPVARALADELPFAMISHQRIPGLTNGPASQSEAAYIYIRDTIGFQGSIMTDDMAMGGSFTEATPDQQTAALAAFDAGADMIMMNGVDAAVVVKEELERRLATQEPALVERIDASVERSLQAKGVVTCPV